MCKTLNCGHKSTIFQLSSIFVVFEGIGTLLKKCITTSYFVQFLPIWSDLFPKTSTKVVISVLSLYIFINMNESNKYSLLYQFKIAVFCNWGVWLENQRFHTFNLNISPLKITFFDSIHIFTLEKLLFYYSYA